MEERKINKHKIINFNSYTNSIKSQILKCFVNEEQSIIFCKKESGYRCKEYLDFDEKDILLDNWLEENSVFSNNYFVDIDGIYETKQNIFWIEPQDEVKIQDVIEILDDFSCVITNKYSKDFKDNVFSRIRIIDNSIKMKRGNIRPYLKTYSYLIDTTSFKEYNKEFNKRLLKCFIQDNESILFGFIAPEHEKDSQIDKIMAEIDDIGFYDDIDYSDIETDDTIKQLLEESVYCNGVEINSKINPNDNEMLKYWCEISEEELNEIISMYYSCIVINTKKDFYEYSFAIYYNEENMYIFEREKGMFTKNVWGRIKQMCPEMKKRGNKIYL